MITFPEGFIAVPRCPGYFIRKSDRQVYSIKSGELKALKLNAKWLSYESHFSLSIKGVRRNLYVTTIERLLNKAEIPYEISIKEKTDAL